MKTRNRFGKWLLLMVLFCFGTGLVTAHAASGKAEAIQAYKTYLEGKPDEKIFALIYLDKDSIPELVLDYGKVYTYKKKTGMSLIHDDYEYDFKKYYKKKGVICADIIPGAVMDYDVVVYSRIVKGKLTSLCGTYHYTNGKWWYQKYSNGHKIITVKKAAFQALLKKYVKKKKPVRIKYYANTEANRSSYLK